MTMRLVERLVGTEHQYIIFVNMKLVEFAPKSGPFFHIFFFAEGAKGAWGAAGAGVVG